MSDFKHYKEYTCESHIQKISWQMSPEADLAVHYSALRGMLGSFGLTDFDVRVVRGDQTEKIAGRSWGDELHFSLTIKAKSRKSALKNADKVYSNIW